MAITWGKSPCSDNLEKHNIISWLHISLYPHDIPIRSDTAPSQSASSFSPIFSHGYNVGVNPPNLGVQTRILQQPTKSTCLLICQHIKK